MSVSKVYLDEDDNVIDDVKQVEKEKLTKKICSFCKREMPISEFGKCKSTKDGYQYYCKTCQKIYRQGAKKLKVCSNCGEAKPIFEYYECRTNKDGLFDMCKECCKTYTSNKPNRKHYEKYFSIET